MAQLSKFIQEYGVQLVTVNPYSVKRCEELDDNSEYSGAAEPTVWSGKSY